MVDKEAGKSQCDYCGGPADPLPSLSSYASDPGWRTGDRSEGEACRGGPSPFKGIQIRSQFGGRLVTKLDLAFQTLGDDVGEILRNFGVELAKGLDAGTAFEILSIDIADVDVGKNIGAELQTDQAEADKRIAQAKAEERRALAVAMEQEYKAEAQKQRALVIAAEAQIPLAMAEAFKKGNMGVMDYQRYRNIQADTSMRQSIAGQGDQGPTGQGS